MGDVNVPAGTLPGNYSLQVLVCSVDPNSPAKARTVAYLEKWSQCALVTLNVRLIEALPSPIPTLGEWGRMLMLLGIAWRLQGGMLSHY